MVVTVHITRRAMGENMRKVTIVQRRLTHYRVPFFEGLRESLEARNIQLTLLVGQSTDDELSKRDGGHLGWATPVKTRYLLNNRLCWMPYYKHMGDTDLLVITQENWQIAHHWVLAKKNKFKLAFWGHGANLQRQGERGWKDRYKDWTTKRADWWFAYTELSKQLVTKTGFPKERVTVVNNTIDESVMREALASVSAADVKQMKIELGFENSRVGLFLGSLHKTKNLHFLLSAARKIKEQVDNFKLLIIGDGPENELVRQFSQSEPWIRWVGALRGREKVLYSLTADFLMNPGMVGLGIVDSFILGLPMVTTDIPTHSPEIAYLVPGVNGLITQPDEAAYSHACLHLMRDPFALINLKMECLNSANKYSLINMISSFSDGIETAINRA